MPLKKHAKCTAVKVALAKIAIKNAGHRAGPDCRGTPSIKVVGEAQPYKYKSTVCPSIEAKKHSPACPSIFHFSL